LVGWFRLHRAPPCRKRQDAGGGMGIEPG
jgi:hypothetical protein